MICQLNKGKIRLSFPPPPPLTPCNVVPLFELLLGTTNLPPLNGGKGEGGGCGREGKFRKYIGCGCKSLLGNLEQGLFERIKQRGTLVYIVPCNWILCALSGHKADPKKHVLIMDEVDGMAGNEDRGGMQVRMIINCR